MLDKRWKKKEREIVSNAGEHIERDMREWNWRIGEVIVV